METEASKITCSQCTIGIHVVLLYDFDMNGFLLMASQYENQEFIPDVLQAAILASALQSGIVIYQSSINNSEIEME